VEQAAGLAVFGRDVFGRHERRRGDTIPILVALAMIARRADTTGVA